MDFCEYIYIYLDGNGGRIDSRQRILFSLSRTIPTNEQKNRTDLIQKWPSVCFPLVVDLLFSSLFLSFFWFLFFFFCSISLLSRSRSTEIHLFTVFLCGWFIDYSQPCKYSFGTNRNAPGQPEDPIFLAMPVISAPSSRVHLVKTERQRERVTRSTFRSKTGIAVSLLPLLGIQDELFFFLFFYERMEKSTRLPESLNSFAIREKCWKGVCENGEDGGKSLLVEWILMASVIGKM